MPPCFSFLTSRESRHKTYFIVVDGVVFKNKGRFGRCNWDTENVPLKRNVEAIKAMAEQGMQIIFCTARPEGQRAKLEASLRQAGLAWYQIIMGCNHAQRVLVNDFADTNPYPSCKAITIRRDGDDLQKYISAGE